MIDKPVVPNEAQRLREQYDTALAAAEIRFVAKAGTTRQKREARLAVERLRFAGRMLPK